MTIKRKRVHPIMMKNKKIRSIAACIVSALVLSTAAPVFSWNAVTVQAAEKKCMTVKEAKAIVNRFMGCNVDFKNTEGLLSLLNDMNLLIAMAQSSAAAEEYMVVRDAVEFLLNA